MILNKLYRLKRKKGAVLFVVIAMMTLLVIMATTAYFTARSSYAGVVSSNYDFSQLYLSTVSVSDMMVNAIANDTVDNTTGKNKFSDLRDAITDETNFGDGKKIVAKSSNITSAMTTTEKILTDTANNPVEEGVLDAVQVVIENGGQSAITYANDTITWVRYYIFTTTGYYKNNVVTIQDVLGYTWDEPVDNKFQTFFTSTGRDDPDSDNRDSRCVVINSKEISDDAYFENEYTIFKDGEPIKFLGGFTSGGTIWIEQFNGSIPAATDTSRNDWVIKDSLILGGNGQNFDLSNNNIIIGGDLILTKNMNTFKAANVYVLGNLIDLSGSANSNIGADVYVAGTFITDLNEYATDSDSLKAAKARAKGTMSAVNAKYKSTMTTATGSDPGDLMGSGLTGSSSTGFNPGSHKLCVNNQADMASAIAGKVTGTWDPENITVPLESGISKSAVARLKDVYLQNPAGRPMDIDKPTKSIVSSDTPEDSGKTIIETSLKDAPGSTVKEEPPAQYTAEQATTMSHTLTIDFSTLTQDKDGEGKAITGQYSGSFDVTGITGTATATVKVTDGNGNGNVVVDLPYCNKGYVLDLKFDGAPFQHKNITYNIDSGAAKDMLPIVLKANFDDGSTTPKDSAGNNAFSWNPGNIDNDGYHTKVQTKESENCGDVFFEVGNYETNGGYFSYTTKKGLNTATYYTNQNLQIGTPNQLSKIDKGNQTDTQLKALLKSGSSDLQDEYDNHFMLVSNKTGGAGINNNRKNTLMCGYIYAPYTDYANWAGAGSAPQLGGICVSNYAIKLSYFVYAEISDSLANNLDKAFIETKKDNAGKRWIVRDNNKGVGLNFAG